LVAGDEKDIWFPTRHDGDLQRQASWKRKSVRLQVSLGCREEQDATVHQ
jgi:hypothetical protein